MLHPHGLVIWDIGSFLDNLYMCPMRNCCLAHVMSLDGATQAGSMQLEALAIC